MERGEHASLQCTGFQTVFARACEYAATSAVTLPIPEEFPGPKKFAIAAAHTVSWPDGTKKPAGAGESMKAKKTVDPYGMLTPEEELATFELAPGYVLQSSSRPSPWFKSQS